jgi:hypothetical protein
MVELSESKKTVAYFFTLDYTIPFDVQKTNLEVIWH